MESKGRMERCNQKKIQFGEGKKMAFESSKAGLKKCFLAATYLCPQFFSKTFKVAFCKLMDPSVWCESVLSVCEMIDGLDKSSGIEHSIQVLIISSQNCDKPFPQGNSY